MSFKNYKKKWLQLLNLNLLAIFYSQVFHILGELG